MKTNGSSGGQNGNTKLRLITNRLRLLVLALLSVTPAAVQAQFTYTTNNGTITITQYTGPDNALSIPDTINGLPVTSIGDYAFYANDSVACITIPDSVTNIGNWAFASCFRLINVMIGNSVSNIGGAAFDDCPSLKGAYFRGDAPLVGGGDGSSGFGGVSFLHDDSVTIYYLPQTGGWLDRFDGRPTRPWDPLAFFTYTTNNSTITITRYTGPGGDVTIPSMIDGLPVVCLESAFNNYSFGWSVGAAYLTSVAIPNGITSIGPLSFSSCSNLAVVTFPDTLTNISIEAFEYCARLGSAAIPNSVSTIEGNAFWYCTSLTNVTLPDRITNIAPQLFQGCSALTGIAIPNSVTSIGVSAFSGCSRLTDLRLGSSVTVIKTSAFRQCGSLTNVVIPNSVMIIGNSAFYYCTNLTGIDFQGNAPANGLSVFDGAQPTVYYLPGTVGWGTTFGDRPTAQWSLPNPLILNYGPGFGIQTNAFSFRISWATNISVVVEACTNLATASWIPLVTNTMGTPNSGWFYFSDPEWTNYPSRIYRVRSR